MFDRFAQRKFIQDPLQAADVLRRFGVSERTIDRVVVYIEHANADLLAQQGLGRPDAQEEDRRARRHPAPRQ